MQMRESPCGYVYDQQKNYNVAAGARNEKSIVLATSDYILQQESSVGVYWHSL